jgi:soluble lytic murein transglycosylase-like protein
MATKTPLAIVKDKFGEKAKLVEAIEKLTKDGLWLSRSSAGKGLAHVSNAKLLRLHATFTEVKEKFGTREKLVDAVLEAEKRAKDTGLRQKLSEWPVPRLFDAYRSAQKRARASKPAGKSAKAATEAPAKTAKAPAKKAAKAPKA